MSLSKLISIYAKPKYKKVDTLHPSVKKEISLLSKDDPLFTLKYYYDKGNYLIHFSDKPDKLSINLKQNWGTPFGTCGYLLNPTFLTHYSQYARNRNYIHIFKCYGSGLSCESYNNFSLDLELLRDSFYTSDSEKIINHAIKTAKNNTQISKLFNVTRLLADEYPKEWSRIFVDVLGYDYIIDNGSGTIHTNEPAQGIALCNGISAPKINVVATLLNEKEIMNSFNNHIIEQESLFFCQYCSHWLPEDEMIFDSDENVCKICYDDIKPDLLESVPLDEYVNYF